MIFALGFLVGAVSALIAVSGAVHVISRHDGGAPYFGDAE